MDGWIGTQRRPVFGMLISWAATWSERVIASLDLMCCHSMAKRASTTSGKAGKKPGKLHQFLSRSYDGSAPAVGSDAFHVQCNYSRTSVSYDNDIMMIHKGSDLNDSSDFLIVCFTPSLVLCSALLNWELTFPSFQNHCPVWWLLHRRAWVWHTVRSDWLLQ